MISHQVSANVLSSSKDREDVTSHVGDTWQQQTGVEEGFRSASCTMLGTRDWLQAWFESALGKHWVAQDIHGNTLWEGMVWGLRLVDEGWQQTRSLDTMANRIRVKYTSYYTGGELNIPSPTTWYEDTTSQATFGIRDQILSIGEAIASKAIGYGQGFLNQQAWPGRSRERSSGEGTALQVDLRGYYSTLAWRVYNDTASTGMTTASALVQAIVNAVGQYVASTKITANAEQTPAYHNRDQFAATILADLRKLGDGVNPWMIGMYEGRTLYYQPVSTEPTMVWYEGAAQPSLIGSGSPVLPWLIRPNDVIRVPWLMRGYQPNVDTIWRDPTAVVVKEVSISMPYSVSITGTHDERLEILLERIRLRKW